MKKTQSKTPRQRSNRSRKTRRRRPTTASRRTAKLLSPARLSFVGLAALGLLIGSGSSPATGAIGSGACPNMPAGNPNPPAKQGTTDIINFAAGSIIIPMDVCYQRPDTLTSKELIDKAVQETYGPGATVDTALCEKTRDSGMIEGYGVVQRLVADGIPVHWSIRAGKTAWADKDFSVAGGAGVAPVRQMAYNGTLSNPYTTIGTISYSGAPFIIDADDADAAKALIASYGSAYDDVNYHLADTSFDAPIYKTMGALPKLAVIDLTGQFTQDKTGFLKGTIGDIGMDASEGVWWEYLDASELAAGELISGGYALAWVPSFQVPNSGPSPSDTNIINALEAFGADGGTVVVQDEGAHAMEGFGSYNGGTNTFTVARAQMMSSSFTHSEGGFNFGFYANAYGNNDASELTASDDYSDPSSQWGGAGWTGIGGSKFDWTARCDAAYRSGVRRMVYTDHQGSGPDNVEFASWKHYDNNTQLGRVYYLGGFNWRKNTHAGFRLQMNTIFVEADDHVGTVEAEVGRSAPIVALVNEVEGQYTGTYDAVFPPASTTVYAYATDAPKFSFPDVTGHLRAISTSELALGNNSYASGAFDPDDPNYNANLVLFDAADVISTMTVQTNSACAIGSGCRHIFTNDGAAKVTFTNDNLNNFKEVFGLATDATDDDKRILMELVHAGVDDGSGGRRPALGGIDRSTLALVESSPIAGGPRPTIAYVGGLDGMMHAICADTVAPCTALGQELWAFLPRSELPKLATNTTRLDGSPKVADVFADFGTGTKEYRTVLTFQTGNAAPSATYALDITNPSEPAILWQHTTPGAGVGTAMAVIHVEGKGLLSATFVQTASGTDTAGMYVAALESGTGEVIWSKSENYPAARDANNSNVPATGLPGGVSVFASDGGDIADTVLVPSLWGAVWAYEARDGSNQNGSTPLFQFTTDFHPIGAPVSVYRDQNDSLLRAVVASGGFADPLSPTSTLWAPDSVNQYAVSFPIFDNTSLPVLDTDVSSSNGALGVFIDLGPGNRAFSQPVILGNEIFLTTDSSDVNSSVFGSGGNTGSLFRVSLASGTATKFSIPSGAASVDVSSASNAVYTGGGNAVQKRDIAGYDASGASVEASAASSAKRYLWLRTH